MKCINCGAENKESAKFCRNCGSELVKAEPVPVVENVVENVKICSHCGSEISADAAFCGICGMSNETTAVEDVVNMAYDDFADGGMNDGFDKTAGYADDAETAAQTAAAERLAQADNAVNSIPEQPVNNGAAAVPVPVPVPQNGGYNSNAGQAGYGGQQAYDQSGQQSFNQSGQQSFNQSGQQSYSQAGYNNQQGGPYIKPWDHTREFDARDISENKVVAMLGYLLGIFGIIIALMGSNDSPYARFHVKQALKFMVVDALNILFALLLCWTLIVPIGLGIFGGILIIVRILCFFSVCKGEAKEPAIIRGFGFLK